MGSGKATSSSVLGALATTALGLAIIDALQAAMAEKVKTPNTGEPDSCYVNPGSGQVRVYGPEGAPDFDIDFHKDHGAGTPHVHIWEPNPQDPAKPGTRGGGQRIPGVDSPEGDGDGGGEDTE
jgi:hypothetical protein